MKGKKGKKKKKKKKVKKKRDFNTTKNVTGTIYYVIMIAVGLLLLLALLGIQVWQFGS